MCSSDLMLWESGAIAISAAANTISMEVPKVTVPDSFTWTIQYSLPGNNDLAGLVIANDPAIGKSFNDYWERNLDGSWATKVLSGSGAKANFYAQVYAVESQVPVVPEPSSLALGAAGVAALLAWQRRRQGL